MTDTSAPLAGIRVLDLSRVLAGPYCAMLLSQLGADVIKVEDKAGDESRTWPPHRQDMGDSFLAMNLNKRGVVVDLKAEEGKALVKRMATSADVLVENFKTGTMERFGLGYDVLGRLNPRLVYTSISAFGRRGPRANDLGYEALMQAYSGVMAITGMPDGEPVRCGVSFLDISTGVMAAFATVTALLQRERTGQGRVVEASLLQSSLGLMSTQVSNFFQHGSIQPKLGSAHPSIVPYQAHATADGDVFIATANQNLWEKLCQALKREDLLRDPRFKDNLSRVKNREACLTEVKATLRQWKTTPLIEHLMAGGVPCARINNIQELMDDGQAQHLGIIDTLQDGEYGAMTVAGLPFSLSGYENRTRRRAPKLGEHTREILGEHGYDPAQIDQLLKQGVVAGG